MGRLPDGLECAYQYAHGAYCKGQTFGVYRVTWRHPSFAGGRRERLICGLHLRHIETAVMTYDIGWLDAQPIIDTNGEWHSAAGDVK